MLATRAPGFGNGRKYRGMVKAGIIDTPSTMTKSVSYYLTQTQQNIFYVFHLSIFFYTSRSRTLLGFATRCDVSADNRRIDTSKWHDNSPLNTFANKSERTLPNDILAQGRGDYRLQLAVIFSTVFAFISHWDVHVMTLREVTGYTWKSRRVTCSLPWTLKRKCRHFDEIFVTGGTEICHFDNFRCSQWWKFHQNDDISVSVNNATAYTSFDDVTPASPFLHVYIHVLRVAKPLYYLKQCWDIVNWTLRKKLQWNFNQNCDIFIQANAFESVVCEMAAIFSRPQCFNMELLHFTHHLSCGTFLNFEHKYIVVSNINQSTSK